MGREIVDYHQFALNFNARIYLNTYFRIPCITQQGDIPEVESYLGFVDCSFTCPSGKGSRNHGNPSEFDLLFERFGGLLLSFKV